MKDLAILVADKNMDFALQGILTRPQTIGIRSLEYEIKQHPGRDGGIRASGPETLALLRSQFRHGLLMLDWEGSGAEAQDGLELERDLDKRLRNLWGNESKAIVIEPELDAWIWGSDNALQEVLEWSGELRIREWLAQRNYEFGENQKPLRPKEAIEDLLKQLGDPRSSALYKKITSKISLARCTDAAFMRLRQTLKAWFSA